MRLLGHPSLGNEVSFRSQAREEVLGVTGARELLGALDLAVDDPKPF
jgi:hypothetical protein